jgi:hypothetical protein
MSSRLALAGLALASALVGGAASSYVAVAFAQQTPAATPAAAPVPARFDHWCQRLDQKSLRVAGERGWELVAAYNDLSETKIYLKDQVASDDLSTTLPAMPTTYCFKRPAR